MPEDVDLFDRGVSRGDVPRLWVDVIAHIEMGRDKRQYRFVQDTRYGRAVLAETYDVPEMVQAVTRYVARRLIERERALADDAAAGIASAQKIIAAGASPPPLARLRYLHLRPDRRRRLAGRRWLCSAAIPEKLQHHAASARRHRPPA